MTHTGAFTVDKVGWPALASPRGHTSVSSFEWLVTPSRYRIERRMPTPIASEAYKGDFIVSGPRAARVIAGLATRRRVVDLTHQGNQ
jgi:hypothetical protein